MAENETIPRWGLQPVDFVDTNPSATIDEIITKYEQASGRTLAPGDPVRIFLLCIADIIIHQRAVINTAAQQNLLSYARGEYLDALGNNLATVRLPASSAVTTLRYTLSQAVGQNVTIPVGDMATNGTIFFATTQDLIIPAGSLTGDVSAVCTVAGKAGNGYLAGQIATAVTPRTFVASVQNITTTIGGSDEEGDAEYAARIRLAPNAFSVAGPTKAYVFNAYSVSPSIVHVSVDSPSPGVVNIYPLLENGVIPGQSILTQVEEHLSGDDIRPLTDQVHAVAPTEVPYTIRVDYWVTRDNAGIAGAIGAAVTQAVENYRLWQQGKIGRDITPDKLICDVMAAGAARVDFSTLSPSSWTELHANEVAQCPTTNVTINYNGVKDE